MHNLLKNEEVRLILTAKNPSKRKTLEPSVTKKPKISINNSVPDSELRRSPRIVRKETEQKAPTHSKLTIEPSEIITDQVPALLYDFYKSSRENTPRNGTGLGIICPSPNRAMQESMNF